MKSAGLRRPVERLALTFLALAIGLHVLADVVPRLLLPIVVLAAVFIAVRLTLFHTRRW